MTTPKKRPKRKVAPSAKRAAASRANGARSAGRPRTPKHLADFARVGPAPIGHPLQLARWVQTVLVLDLERLLNGRAHDGLSQSIRATATAISRAMPTDIMVAAEQLIRADGAQIDADKGPQTETDAEDQRAQPLYCATPRG